jgi:peptidoglycan/LPS O-acetylase OafA/YrhL
LLVAGIIAASLLAAQLASWLVEKPSDQLGQVLSRRQKPA